MSGNLRSGVGPPERLAWAALEVLDAEREVRHPPLSLRLLESFELRLGSEPVVIPRHSQRVVAFLASQDRPQLRSKVAFSLWADTTEARARASLRTALWKINSLGVVDVRGSYLSIVGAAEVDLHHLVAQARRLIAPEGALQAGDVNPDGLRGDLLPDWEEDWLLFERERVRQLRLHALEALSSRLFACGRHAESIDAAQAAVAAEPLRESAQGTLIRAHLAEGNLCEARRQFETFSSLLLESLGHSPSPELRAIVFALSPDAGVRTGMDAHTGC